MKNRVLFIIAFLAGCSGAEKFSTNSPPDDATPTPTEVKTPVAPKVADANAKVTPVHHPKVKPAANEPFVPLPSGDDGGTETYTVTGACEDQGDGTGSLIDWYSMKLSHDALAADRATCATYYAKNSLKAPVVSAPATQFTMLAAPLQAKVSAFIALDDGRHCVQVKGVTLDTKAGTESFQLCGEHVHGNEKGDEKVVDVMNGDQTIALADVTGGFTGNETFALKDSDVTVRCISFGQKKLDGTPYCAVAEKKVAEVDKPKPLGPPAPAEVKTDEKTVVTVPAAPPAPQKAADEKPVTTPAAPAVMTTTTTTTEKKAEPTSPSPTPAVTTTTTTTASPHGVRPPTQKGPASPRGAAGLHLF